MNSFAKLEYRYHRVVREFRLCLTHLAGEENVWRYPRTYCPEIPAQGFKIHLSFTVLEFPKYARAVVRYLHSRRISFKVVRDLETLLDLNCGKYGFAQTGKAFTIYSSDAKQFHQIVDDLADLCFAARGPRVPSDKKAPIGSNIFYRYGPFVGSGDSIRNEAMDTTMVDRRDPLDAIPKWLDDPFPSDDAGGNLPGDLVILSQLRQRPKGGVYDALWLDHQHQKVQPVVVKEARRWGEEDMFGVDAVQRLKNQEFWLKRLDGNPLTPNVIRSFTNGENYYLVMQKVEGESFEDWLKSGPSRLLRRCVYANLNRALDSLHNEGVFLCDLSADNIIVSDGGKITFTDLELAWRSDLPVLSNYGTVEYMIHYPGVFPLTKDQARRRDHYALQRLKCKLSLAV